MEFKKYQHIERFGTSEVEGIEVGECFIFPKIDGTNSSVWMKDGELKAGSRKKELTLENDNAGFYSYAIKDNDLINYLNNYPNHRLYGEWLVPHSLKTYRADTWKKFYVFDVCIDKNEEEVEYIQYDIYKPMLEKFNINYIPALAQIKNGSNENFIKLLEENIFLVKDGQGVGEGIVIKNYDYYNKFKRQTWAKIVTSEFKQKSLRKKRTAEINGTKVVEESIVEKYCTEAFIEKEYQKIVNENQGWSSKFIPQLFGRLFSELVKEEMWNIVKEFKQPTINFRTLNLLMIEKIKEIKDDKF